MQPKTFGQFRVDQYGIKTVGGVPFIWIEKESILQKNPKPVAYFLKQSWVNKQDLYDAYQYAKKVFFGNEILKQYPEKRKQMRTEYKALLWKKNSKGNYVAKTDNDHYITVFRDAKSNNRLKWVVGDEFSSSSHTDVERAKKDAFKYYFMSKLKK